MAIMTARKGQHDLIQFLKNPRLRDRHFLESTPHIEDTGAGVMEDCSMKIEIETSPAAEDMAVVRAGLNAFNESDVGPGHFSVVAIFLRSDGQVRAGLLGTSEWASLHIEKIWVAEELRGKGIASQLLDAAEAEAKKRSYRFAWLDTLNPDAARLYERRGYKPFGKIEDFVDGRPRCFYMKRL